VRDPEAEYPEIRELPSHAADGTDLTLIRWALDLTPAERLRAFEALMADIVKMLDAAHRT
jgi:hypothetical protein